MPGSDTHPNSDADAIPDDPKPVPDSSVGRDAPDSLAPDNFAGAPEVDTDPLRPGERSSTLAMDSPVRRPDPAPNPNPSVSRRRHWFFRSTWASLFTVAGTLVAVVSLVLAAFSYFSPNDPTKIAKPRIAKVELNTVKEVESQLDIEGEPFDNTRTGDATVDITLENSGGTAFLIESAAVVVEHIDQIERCAGGGGPVRITGLYDVRIPLDAKAPYATETALSFQVLAGSFDRLAISVGPAVWYEADYPSLYRLRITLRTSAGMLLETGPVALLSSLDYFRLSCDMCG